MENVGCEYCIYVDYDYFFRNYAVTIYNKFLRRNEKWREEK